MRFTRKHWISLAVGITILLAAFGVALAVTIVQVSREVPSTLSLSSAVVISSDNLGLWHDEARKEPVTSLKFQGIQFEPPLDSFSRDLDVEVFIENRSDIDLTLIAPCGGVESPPGTFIGKVETALFELATGKEIGTTCDRKSTLAPGEMVRAHVHIHLEKGLADGDYDFTTVFGASGESVDGGGPVEGDVNGDGVPDFIVGARFDDPAGGGSNAGSAYVFSGADGSLLYHMTGDTASDEFGHSVSLAGDVNGDGRADFIVGARLDDPAGGGINAGSAYVFSEADGSLLYHMTGDTVGDQFGYSVSGAGDVNGDGRADFIVGAHLDDPAGGGTDAGSAYVFSGADGSLLYHVTGDTAVDQFGYSVSGAGDVNGDGKADFIVGAYIDDPAGGGTDAGSAYVFSGTDGSLLYQRTGDTASDFFGISVSGAGDVNGDGRADFIVGANADDPAGGGTNAGSAYVFSGADGSLLYQRTGDTASDFFGYSVSMAGDVNGDGRADFIVGARFDDPAGGGNSAGSAYVFSGADGGLLYQRTGDSASDNFGWSVSGAGDVNGDGRADFIVGARLDDPAGGGTDAGSVYVFSGADGSLLYQRTGDSAGDRFGYSVGGAK